LGTWKKIPPNVLLILSLIAIVRHVNNNNNQGYIKMQSLVLRAFSTIFHEIIGVNNMILGSGRTIRAVLVGYPCALSILCQRNAKNISSEDLNHGIAILRTVRVSLLNFDRRYVMALANAVIICISREIETSKEMTGFMEGQLIEAQTDARHNSEALEKGIRPC
jgi:hypothetical protein